MNTLPDQDYVSLGDAAKRLSVDLSTLANYIKDNLLQLAIRLPKPEDKFTVDVREISSFNERLSRSYDVYQIITQWVPIPVGRVHAPKYLLVDFDSPIICYTDEPPHLYKAMCFLSTDRNRLVLLNSIGQPEFACLGEKDKSGLFIEGLISVADIRTFLKRNSVAEDPERLSTSNSKTDSGEECVQETLISDPGNEVSKVGKQVRSNPVREVLWFYRDRFRDEFKFEPTFEQFLQFMLRRTQDNPKILFPVSAYKDGTYKLGAISSKFSKEKLKDRFDSLPERPKE